MGGGEVEDSSGWVGKDEVIIVARGAMDGWVVGFPEGSSGKGSKPRRGVGDTCSGQRGYSTQVTWVIISIEGVVEFKRIGHLVLQSARETVQV